MVLIQIPRCHDNIPFLSHFSSSTPASLLKRSHSLRWKLGLLVCISLSLCNIIIKITVMTTAPFFFPPFCTGTVHLSHIHSQMFSLTEFIYLFHFPSGKQKTKTCISRIKRHFQSGAQNVILKNKCTLLCIL